MREYDLKIKKIENGYVLTIEVPAPEESAAESLIWGIYLRNQENLFNCISIYYEQGHESALEYARTEEKVK